MTPMSGTEDACLNDPDLALEIDLERLFHKNQLIPRLRDHFFSEALVSYAEAWSIPLDFCLDFLVQIYLHRQANVETMVGLTHRHFTRDEPVPTEESLQACVDACLRMVEAKLAQWDSLRQLFLVAVMASKEIQAELDRFQFPLPLVVPPREIRENNETGYHLADVSHGSVILRTKAARQGEFALDHLNRANAVPYRLNTDVVAVMRNQWRNLKAPKPGESEDEFQSRLRAFDKFDRNSREVIEGLLLAQDRFWLTHKYDRRGRCYAVGYHVNPQGNDWQKACVEFAEAELVR